MGPPVGPMPGPSIDPVLGPAPPTPPPASVPSATADCSEVATVQPTAGELFKQTVRTYPCVCVCVCVCMCVCVCVDLMPNELLDSESVLLGISALPLESHLSP